MLVEQRHLPVSVTFKEGADPEQNILNQRYPQEPGQNPQTILQIAKELKISTTPVYQVHKRALAKLEHLLS